MKNKIKILTIDDDNEFNVLLKRRMEQNGYSLTITNNVKDFTEKLKQDSPDLCFLDVELQESTEAGFTLLRAIRKKWGHTVPIFLFTSRTDLKDIIYGLEMGADDYVTKPPNFNLLFSKISKHLSLHDENEKADRFKRVPQEFSRCVIDVDFKIHSVNEYGLTLQSTNYISKGTLVKLNIPQIIPHSSEKHACTVSSVWKENDMDFFYINIDFDPEDRTIIEAVRHWLSDRAQESKR